MMDLGVQQILCQIDKQEHHLATPIPQSLSRSFFTNAAIVDTTNDPSGVYLSVKLDYPATVEQSGDWQYFLDTEKHGWLYRWTGPATQEFYQARDWRNNLFWDKETFECWHKGKKGEMPKSWQETGVQQSVTSMGYTNSESKFLTSEHVCQGPDCPDGRCPRRPAPDRPTPTIPAIPIEHKHKLDLESMAPVGCLLMLVLTAFVVFKQFKKV